MEFGKAGKEATESREGTIRDFFENHRIMNTEIDVLIIEDELVWVNTLRNTLNDFGYNIVGTASDFEAAISALNKKNYDLVLLDIHLQGKNRGIELGGMIHNLYHKPFIYITGTERSYTLQQIADTCPSAYLTKPFDPGSLVVAIQNAIGNFTEQRAPDELQSEKEYDFLFIKYGTRYKRLEWKDIVFLRSEKNYTALHNAADRHDYHLRSTLPRTMKFIVPPSLRPDFVQVNRSEAVQISYIKEVTQEEVRTDYGAFAITGTYMDGLRRFLKMI